MQKRHKNKKVLFHDEKDLFNSKIALYNYGYVQKNRTSMHKHEYIEIGLCISGTGVYFVENDVFPFSSGDVSVIFPNQPHIAESQEKYPSVWKYLNINIDEISESENRYIKSFLEKILLYKNNIQNIINAQSSSDISLLANLIFNELEEKKENYRLNVYALLASFFIKVSRIRKSDALIKALEYKKSTDYNIISPALNYIFYSYKNQITLKELADMCHISETYFRRIFKRHTGKTPFEYLYNTRIKMSEMLLKSTNLPVTQIAMDVGYRSISSFNRHFKEYSGTTPVQYRKNVETV